MAYSVLLLGVFWILVCCAKKSSGHHDISFDKEPVDQTVGIGGEAEFDCKSRPPANHTHWFLNGVRISQNYSIPKTKIYFTGGNLTCQRTKLTITPVVAEHYGQYMCVVFTVKGVANKTAWLRQQSSSVDCSLGFMVKPENRWVEVHEYVELECIARNADANTVVTWYKSTNGSEKRRINSDSELVVVETGLLILSAQYRHTANYTCEVKTSRACSISSTATVSVYKDVSEVCGRPTNFQRLFQTLSADRRVPRRSIEAQSAPWQVSLQNKDGKHICGGVVLTRHDILTAGHCVIKQPNVLRFGREHLFNSSNDNWFIAYDKHEQVRLIDRILFHPYFKQRELDYDMAIVRLQTPLKFTDYVMPMCLPLWERQFEERTKTGRHGLITGWGTGGSTLQEAVFQIQRSETCSHNLTESMFCTAGGSVLAGDSGGPFGVAVKIGDKPTRVYLAGIISGGWVDVQKDEQYSFYSNVSIAKAWLIQNLDYWKY